MLSWWPSYHIAAPIRSPIEDRWATTRAAPAAVVDLLIAAFGDGRMRTGTTRPVLRPRRVPKARTKFTFLSRCLFHEVPCRVPACLMVAARAAHSQTIHLLGSARHGAASRSAGPAKSEHFLIWQMSHSRPDSDRERTEQAKGFIMRTTETGRAAHVVVLGGGPAGLTAALLLARDGHRVTLLDKDTGAPSGEPEHAWEEWRRSGVTQFRHPHILMPGAYRLLTRELPDAVAALRNAGARTHNMLGGAYDLPAIGGRIDGDDRFDTLAARRPVIEAALAQTAAHSGISIRRETAVTGFVTTAEGPRITGVVTASGATIAADLVVDALGRNSPAGAMLTAAGAAAPQLHKHDTGFLAYSRYFRSADGSTPAQATWPLYHHDSLSITTVPGDAGTWALAVFVSGRDRALRALSDPEAWQRAMALYPDTAHWAAHGEPLTGVLAMSGMEARHRRLIVDGRPVATGLLSIGDAWATTDPAFGMGITMGMTHALLLRDVLREHGIEDTAKLALRFDEVTESTLGPLYQATADWDLHRLAQIDGEITGVPYASDDPNWALRQALEVAKLRDPDVLRAFGDVGSLLSGPDEALARPGVLDRIVRLGGGAARYPEAGPARAELLAVLGAK